MTTTTIAPSASCSACIATATEAAWENMRDAEHRTPTAADLPTLTEWARGYIADRITETPARACRLVGAHIGEPQRAVKTTEPAERRPEPLTEHEAAAVASILSDPTAVEVRTIHEDPTESWSVRCQRAYDAALRAVAPADRDSLIAPNVTPVEAIGAARLYWTVGHANDGTLRRVAVVIRDTCDH